MAQSRLFGDWEKAGRTFKQMQATFDKVGNEPSEKCAKLYLNKLKDNIETQSLPFAPLNEYYLANKKKKGLDERTLIATGDYLSQLRIKPIGDKKIFVGAYQEDIHEPSGLSMSYIGQVLEYGTKDGRIPPRPHYRPTWEDVKNQCRDIWFEAGRKFFRWR